MDCTAGRRHAAPPVYSRYTRCAHMYTRRGMCTCCLVHAGARATRNSSPGPRTKPDPAYLRQRLQTKPLQFPFPSSSYRMTSPVYDHRASLGVVCTAYRAGFRPWSLPRNEDWERETCRLEKRKRGLQERCSLPYSARIRMTSLGGRPALTAIWDTYTRIHIRGWRKAGRGSYHGSAPFDRPNTHTFLLSPNQLGIIRVLIKLSFTHRSGVLTVSLAKTYCLTRLLEYQK